VLIASADVRADDLEDHSMIGPPAARIDQLGKVDAPDLNFAGTDVNDSTITCHDLQLLVA
jgi:hypothetical protein